MPSQGPLLVCVISLTCLDRFFMRIGVYLNVHCTGEESHEK